MVSENPKALDDISSYLLFEAKDKKYLIGSIKNDRYIIVNDYEEKIFLGMLKDLNGENTIDYLSNKWGIKKEKTIEIIKFFYLKGLLEESENEKNSEVRKLSKYIGSVSCDFINKISQNMICIILRIIYFLVIVLALVNLYFIFNRDLGLITIFQYKNSYLYGIILSSLIMIPSFFFHEFSHALMARKYGLYPSKIELTLYLCLFPLFYVRINGIYTIERKKRIKILLAGFLGNIFIAVISLFLYVIFRLEILKMIVMAQFNIIMVNCNPFNLTDGYFISTQLFKNVNIRSNLFYYLANDIRMLFKSEKTILLYAIFNMFIIVATAFYYSNYTINVITEIFGFKTNNNLASFLNTLIICLLYFIIIRCRYKNCEDKL